MLVVVLLGVATTSLPLSLLAASLDTIRTDLHASFSTISWLQVAPSLAAGVSVPIFGKLSDLLGARRVFRAAIGLTVLLSLLTAAAWSAGSLIAFRTLGQVVGTASGPAGFALVGHCCSGATRARAIGRVGMVSAVAPVIGIAVGGPLVDHLGWQTLFLIQTIPAALCFVLAMRWLPEVGERRAVRFDVAGAVLLAASVLSALFALNRIRAWGIGHPAVLGGFAVAPVLATAFTAVERRVSHPLAPLGYLRRRDFSAGILTLSFVLATFMGGSIVVPLLLQRRYGYDLSAIALIVAARPLGYSVGSWSVPRLRLRLGARNAQLFAAVVLAASGFLLVQAAVDDVVAAVVASFVLSGFASGVLYTGVITSINEIADRADVGVTNGIASMMGTIGSAIGVTAASAVVGDATDSGAFVAVFLLLCASGAVTIVTTLIGARRPAVGAPVTASTG